MEKNIKIIIIAIIIFVIIFFGIELLLPQRNEPTVETDIGVTTSTPSILTANECTARGGEIINTLTTTSTYASSDILGEVEEMRCPCLCIKKGNNSNFFISE